MWPAIISAVGSIAGGLLGSRGSSGSQNQESRLNDYTLPFYSWLLNEGPLSYWGYANQPYTPYEGQRVAGADPFQQEGWDKLAWWANQGSPELNDASSVYRSALTGDEKFSPRASTMNPVMSNFSPERAQATMAPSAQQTQMTAMDNPHIWVNSPNLTNPYIGGQTGKIAGVGNALDVVGDLGPASLAQAYGNPLFGLDNPYTGAAVKNAQSDVVEAYRENAMPQLDRLMQQSGSFGNTGVQELQKDATRNFAEQLGNISEDMRYKDLFSQQQMGESDAARRTGVSTANANALNTYGLGRAGLLGSLSTSDLNRLLGTQEFNANLDMSDLARNAALYQQAGMFNVGNQVGDLRQGQNLTQDIKRTNTDWANRIAMDNASRGSDRDLYNTNVANQFALTNTAAVNDAGLRQALTNAGFGNQAGEFNANAFNTMSSRNADRLNQLLGMGFRFDDQYGKRGGVLADMGGTRRGITQQQLDWPYQQFMEGRYQYPERMLNLMEQGVRLGNPGASTVSSTQYPGNWLTGAMGGGLMANSLAKYFTQPNQTNNYGGAYGGTGYTSPGAGYEMLGGWQSPWAGYYGEG